MAAAVLSEQSIPQFVTDAYGAKAKVGVTSSYANGVAEAFGYTKEQLESIPAEANMGLSCGNPVAAATIKEGEVVVDLGSGGGIDIFLAASKVGPNGRAIGLDGSADMIALARRNAAKKNLNPPRVAFVHTLLTEKLPIVSESVDCILSNCVVNLLPPSGKASLMQETHRILKPGGRIVLDDIIAKVPLPDDIRNDLGAYVGCISGAIEVEEYKRLLNDAGFKDVLFVDTRKDINVYHTTDNAPPATTNGGCCGPTQTTNAVTTSVGCCAQPKPITTSVGCCAQPTSGSSSIIDRPDFDANKWVSSYQIYATKVGAAPSSKVTEVLEHWWDPYPAIKATPSQLIAEELSDLIRSSKSESEFAVIDVRRGSRAGGTIRGSYQWEGQIFPNNLADFFEKFKDTKKVIFYCNSSTGSAPRCAGWYQDYLNDVKKTHSSQAYVLQGGFNGWLEKYSDLVNKE